MDLHDAEQHARRNSRSVTGAWEEIERLTERVQELERDAEQSRKTIAGCMTTLASDGVLSADQIEWITEFARPGSLSGSASPPRLPPRPTPSPV